MTIAKQTELFIVVLKRLIHLPPVMHTLLQHLLNSFNKLAAFWKHWLSVDLPEICEVPRWHLFVQ